MKQIRWLYVLPLGFAAALFSGSAAGSEIRDEAGMFSPGAVKEVVARLDRFEKTTRIPVVIETIDGLGLGDSATKAEKHEAVRKLALERDRASGNKGVFLLISQKDRVISNTLIPRRLASSLPESTRLQIRDAFVQGVGSHMKAEGRTSPETADQDAGLKSLVSAVERAADLAARNGADALRRGLPGPADGRRPMDAGRAAHPGGGTSGIMTFVMIGIGILAVLFFVRLIGGLFGGARHPSGMGGMGMHGHGPGFGPGYGPGRGPGPGYDPGYGGPGYGPGFGGRGGFFSGMLGGLGGALAGNWLYDQMTGGRGHGHSQASSYPTTGTDGGYTSPGDEPIIGGDDGGGGGASWGDGGGDWGGGDWGGGDGGGDW